MDSGTPRVVAASTILLALVDALVVRPFVAVAGLASAATNLVLAAMVGLLVLAQPAFRETGPDWLRQLDLAVTFVDRTGAIVGRRGIRHDDLVELSEYPRHLIDAVLATEDRRFWRHYGVDPVGIVRALVANSHANGVVQGGSTITQQLAKNLFLTGDRTVERKISEAFLAFWLEAHLSKAEILKLYLDRAYLGSGAFGMEAAAEVYFGKSVRDVTLAEAAILAGLLKAPSRYAPNRHPEEAASRAFDVLDNLAEAGLADRATVAAAKREPARAIPRSEAPVRPDYYLDWAFREVQRLSAAGTLGRDSVLTVEVALDPAVQENAEAKVEAALEREGERQKVEQAAMVVMRPDGAVIALVGGRDYGESQFNRAVDAHRQTGSAFKPFVYATALAKLGLRPWSIVTDTEICISGWCPANYSRSFSGPMPLASALARSINSVAVRLPVDIGREAGEWTVAGSARFGRARVSELVRALGVASPLPDAPSLPLGVADLTLLETTAAYAAFASGGFRAEPHAALAIHNARGELLWRRPAAPGRRVLGPRLVRDMNDMLAKVVEAGTARRAALPGYEVGGKTGTTSAYRDAWFLGFTGHLVAGIWLGNDDSRPTRRITGGGLPVEIWREVMSQAHRGLPQTGLARPDPEDDESGGAALAAAGGTGIREAKPVPAPVARSAPAFREIGATPASFREAPRGPGLATIRVIGGASTSN